MFKDKQGLGVRGGEGGAVAVCTVTCQALHTYPPIFFAVGVSIFLASVIC